MFKSLYRSISLLYYYEFYWSYVLIFAPRYVSTMYIIHKCFDVTHYLDQWSVIQILVSCPIFLVCPFQVTTIIFLVTPGPCIIKHFDWIYAKGALSWQSIRTGCSQFVNFIVMFSHLNSSLFVKKVKVSLLGNSNHQFSRK